MSHILQQLSINTEGVCNVLYEMVKSMLASDHCVKCIAQDESIIFTCDAECMMSALEMEHPAGHLVAQALSCHKRAQGTGTKTLLFMIASLAKAVSRLHELGIPTKTSVCVIQDMLNELAKDVQKIAVTEALPTTSQGRSSAFAASPDGLETVGRKTDATLNVLTSSVSVAAAEERSNGCSLEQVSPLSGGVTSSSPGSVRCEENVVTGVKTMGKTCLNRNRSVTSLSREAMADSGILDSTLNQPSMNRVLLSSHHFYKNDDIKHAFPLGSQGKMQKKQDHNNGPSMSRVLLASRHLYKKDDDDIKDDISFGAMGQMQSSPEHSNLNTSLTITSKTLDFKEDGDKCTLLHPSPDTSSVEEISDSILNNQNRLFGGINQASNFSVQDVHEAAHKELSSLSSFSSYLESELCQHVLRLDKILTDLHDCRNDVGEVAQYILQRQIARTNVKRLNLNQVSCMQLPASSVSSLSSSFLACGWRSSLSPSMSVVPGLIIPCDTTTLVRLNTEQLTTLLINADLTPNYHHQGYKPTLKNRKFVEKSTSAEDDSHSWHEQVLAVVQRLQVKLLLVKGHVDSCLLDMLNSANVVVLEDVKLQTLRVLSHLHRVVLLTYVKSAEEASVCRLHLKPLSTSSPDFSESAKSNLGKHFVVVTDAGNIQTVVLHCSNDMSAQLLEEKLWKCLHSLHNCLRDGQVLPGAGATEQWCYQQVLEKCNRSSIQGLVLEALGDVFMDYYSTVRPNTEACRESLQLNSKVTEPLPEKPVYDNFHSKISAWMTAIDVVCILENLGSLVITGINQSSVNTDTLL